MNFFIICCFFEAVFNFNPNFINQIGLSQLSNKVILRVEEVLPSETCDTMLDFLCLIYNLLCSANFFWLKMFFLSKFGDVFSWFVIVNCCWRKINQFIFHPSFLFWDFLAFLFFLFISFFPVQTFISNYPMCISTKKNKIGQYVIYWLLDRAICKKRKKQLCIFFFISFPLFLTYYLILNGVGYEWVMIFGCFLQFWTFF